MRTLPEASQGLPDGGQVARHFHEAHHGQCRGRGENPHPLGGHGLAADAEERRVRAKLPHGRHQAGGMIVPGSLPGDHKDLGGLTPRGKRGRGEKGKGAKTIICIALHIILHALYSGYSTLVPKLNLGTK